MSGILENKIEYYSKVLDRIKAEHNKRNILYSHYHIDLINYENEYTTLLLETIVYELFFANKDDIDWWLYEDVEKVYYLEDDSVVNVEDSQDFLRSCYRYHTQ